MFESVTGTYEILVFRLFSNSDELVLLKFSVSHLHYVKILQKSDDQIL